VAYTRRSKKRIENDPTTESFSFPWVPRRNLPTNRAMAAVVVAVTVEKCGSPKPTLAWAKDVGADLAKTNVNGGAIAIGHPLGVSGARIMTTMVNALEQRGGRYALQTMCEGGGMANATIIERLG
jgi:acetyl-CoA acetyltransferase